MAFQPVPDCVEVVFHALQNGVPVVNVWNVDCNVPVTPTQVSAIAAIFDGWNTSDWLGKLDPSYVLQDITATDISVASGFQVILPPTHSAGTAGGGPQAANAALVCSFLTGFSGRSFRGRTYVPALTDAIMLNAQNVTGAYAASINVAFTNLIIALQVATYTLSVLSRVTAGALRVTGLLTEIVGVLTNTKIDSQRRRTAN